MPLRRPATEAENCPAKLLNHDSFDRTFVRCLLDGVLVHRRDLFEFYLGYGRAHFEDLRAGIAAQTTGSARILDSNSHTCLPYPLYVLQFADIVLASRLITFKQKNRKSQCYSGNYGICCYTATAGIVNWKFKTANQFYRPGPMQTEPANLVRRGTEQP